MAYYRIDDYRSIDTPIELLDRDYLTFSWIRKLTAKNTPVVRD